MTNILLQRQARNAWVDRYQPAFYLSNLDHKKNTVFNVAQCIVGTEANVPCFEKSDVSPAEYGEGWFCPDVPSTGSISALPGHVKRMTGAFCVIRMAKAKPKTKICTSRKCDMVLVPMRDTHSAHSAHSESKAA